MRWLAENTDGHEPHLRCANRAAVADRTGVVVAPAVGHPPRRKRARVVCACRYIGEDQAAADAHRERPVLPRAITHLPGKIAAPAVRLTGGAEAARVRTARTNVNETHRAFRRGRHKCRLRCAVAYLTVAAFAPAVRLAAFSQSAGEQSANLIVVDEASMCDTDVAAWLLRAVAPGARVLWCGDADQLPSVGPGQVLADLIKSGVVPSACLTRIYRQAARSPIVRNARLLLDGKPLDLSEQVGWRFVPAERSLSHVPDQVLSEVRLLLGDGLSQSDLQVLAPVRRGPLGVESLNLRLQDLLNPSGAMGPWVGGGVRARIGDRVIATWNIYDLEEPLFNGEQGVVVEANPNGSLTVDLGDRSVSLRGIYCFMLRLAWAVTVHRSQGSEYPAVVLAYDHRAHGPMLDRRLLYTAITRAQRHCSIVGTRDALARSLSQTLVRETTLAHHLAELLPHVGRPHRGGRD
jgi:hypothetical protein